MLTWQNNLPRFVVKGSTGERMILYFGCTNIDDIEISEFHFVIQLSEHQGKWSLETQWHQYGDCTRKPRMGVFLSKLNLAISIHKDFDFREYLHRWRHKDAHFSAVIVNTIGHPKEYRSIF
jgi:hypothetical protein